MSLYLGNDLISSMAVGGNTASEDEDVFGGPYGLNFIHVQGYSEDFGEFVRFENLVRRPKFFIMFNHFTWSTVSETYALFGSIENIMSEYDALTAEFDEASGTLQITSEKYGSFAGNCDFDLYYI